MKPNLFGLTYKELEECLTAEGADRYRAEQVFAWLYHRMVVSFAAMENLPKSLRAFLAERHDLAHPEIVQEQRSSDGTRKFLLKTTDGSHIETVLIPAESEEAGVPKRLTLCVSTQVGCPLDCVFCATAAMKLRRNLTTGEIVGQYVAVQRVSDARITNIVYMGMGEPMLNYDAVMRSVEIITHEKTCGVSSGRITISTAGLPDGIRRLADEQRKVKLAISLHATTDALRLRLMPVNKRYPLAELMSAAAYYYAKTRRRITYEYIVFHGLNDTPADVRRLVKLARRISSKINLIPWHSIDHSGRGEDGLTLEPAPPGTVEDFAQALRAEDITVMLRSSSGKDIAAACGQLVVKRRDGAMTIPTPRDHAADNPD
jgi:23S rRNA (adenine2503-C2)-methyltransferase